MRPFLSFAALLFCFHFAQAEYTPSGRAKAFKGPEGEVVAFIPLDNDKKILIYAENTYGPTAGKTLIYTFNNDSTPRAGVLEPGNDPEKQAMRMVLTKREGQWIYFDRVSDKKILEIKLVYSEELSKKLNTKKLLHAAVEVNI